MRLYIAALLFFFITAISSKGQLPVSLNFTNYTRANGLPEENINNIVQDSRGFLWIGTREGLVRFDGHSYKAWYADPADNSKFSSNNITLIDEIIKGKLYFTSGSVLWSINIYNHKFEQVPQFAGKQIVGTPQRISNNKWCISEQDTLHIIDNRLQLQMSIPLKKMYPHAGPATAFQLQYPYALVYANGSPNMYLLNYNAKQLTNFSIDTSLLDSRSGFFLPFAYDSLQKRLYLSSYFNGIFYIDLHMPLKAQYNPVKISMLTDGAIRKAMLLSENRLLMGGENGLYLTDFTKKVIFNTSSLADKPMASQVVLNICQTKDENFWLSTTSGIVRFSLNEPIIKYWRKELSLPKGDEIKAIFKQAGSLYFLSQQKSLFSISKEKNIVKRLDSSIYYCWSAIKAGNDIIFTGAGKRIGIYNTLSDQLSYPSFLVPYYTNNTDLVTLVFKAKNGDCWYSCNGGSGLIRQPAGTNQYINYSRNTNPPSFSHSYVHSAAEDKDGNIWWASNKTSLLLRWDKNLQKFSEHGIDKLVAQQKARAGVTGIFIDEANNLWAALDAAGLLKYNLTTKTGDYYDINKGLPADVVYGMQTDSKNRLWFGTRKGLCCYLPESDKIIAFTIYDGLPEDDFDGDGIYYDKEENTLYVGAKQSIAYFNPDSLLLKSTSNYPPVFIDEMLVNGKVYHFENENNIRLKTRENNIEFSFASPDYNRSSQLIFQYQLKGISNDWIELGNKRNVTFNSLPHGRYTLLVRCKYKGTERWSETKLPFSFTIKTPWTKSWWFRLLIIVLASLLVGWIIRNYYQRKMEKQKMLMEKELAIEQERTRVARELHDGLGSMLSGIKHSFAAMQNQMPLNSEQQIKFHSNINKLNESIKELRNIAHSMSADNLLKFGLENSLRDYCINISQYQPVKVAFASINTENLHLSEEKAFHCFRIVQELLQNISKHSNANNAIVQISRQHNHLNIAVEDDGEGFDIKLAALKKGMGLKNVEARVKILKGNFDYRTAPGKGTSVLIDIPVTD